MFKTTSNSLNKFKWVLGLIRIILLLFIQVYKNRIIQNIRSSKEIYILIFRRKSYPIILKLV